jgi:hypothetical protein
MSGMPVALTSHSPQEQRMGPSSSDGRGKVSGPVCFLLSPTEWESRGPGNAHGVAWEVRAGA